MSQPVSLAATLVERFSDAGTTLAVAESLTGGLLSAELTSVPGASAMFRGSVVAYAADIKERMTQVPAEILEQHGTVSEPTALAMAAGVRAAMGATWGVATTGVAGPAKSEGHPVGTVFVAAVGPGRAGEETRRCQALRLSGDRGQIREAAVEAAIQLIETSVRDQARSAGLQG